MVLTQKQKETLKQAEDKGWLTQGQVIGIYATQSSASRGLSRMVESGLLEEDSAPPNKPKNKVYYLTDLGQDLLRHSDS